MAIVQQSLIRNIDSGTLGDGTRSVQAVVTALRVDGDPDVITTKVTISQLSNMTVSELAAYQTFVNSLDEQALACASLIALDSAPQQ